MRCLVTAGPTFEPLDAVRRLTNFSTGRLGSELAGFLAGRGHEVTLFLGQQATWRGSCPAQHVESFTTTADLRERLLRQTAQPPQAIFHAAAVSDFAFGKIWRRMDDGRLEEVRSGKFSTRQGDLLAELTPTPKLLAEFRDWFPSAQIIGWKYEVDGDRARAIELAREQIVRCRVNACVVNGPSYGVGFGLLSANGAVSHFADPSALFTALERFVRPAGTM